MTQKKKILISSLAIALVAGSLSVTAANAHGRDNAPSQRVAVQNAVENGNFAAFQRAAEGVPFLEEIDTPKEFSAIVLAHELRKEGKYKEAKEVLEDAGIKTPRQKQSERARIRSTIEHGDWHEFMEAVAGMRIARIIDTKEKFERFLQGRALRTEGRHGEADEVMESLGMRGCHMER